VSARNAAKWRHVVDDLADALQVAIRFAAHVRRNAHTTAYDTVRLQASMARALSILDGLGPSKRTRKRRRDRV
jgi:hypothetical protein